MPVSISQPPHGWRALAWEVVVVVVGVLIALGAQQLAENLSWRDKVAVQREALDADIAAGIGSIALRQVWQPCLDRRTEEIEQLLSARAQGRSIPVVGHVGAPYRVWEHINSYDGAVDDGSLAKMPFAVRRNYEDLVSNIRNVNRLHEQEFQVWLELQRLEHPDRMTDADWSDVRGVMGEIRVLDQRLKTAVASSEAKVPKGTKLPDLRGEMGDEPWGDDFCRPLLAPAN